LADFITPKPSYCEAKAEGVRFELTVPYGTPHFKCGALDLSATLPRAIIPYSL
jgi:hypothetical protein